jgi:hypothetical protein
MLGLFISDHVRLGQDRSVKDRIIQVMLGFVMLYQKCQVMTFYVRLCQVCTG